MVASSNSDKGCSQCKCLPYKDAVLITAQALAIVGMFMTWTTWWNILISLTGFTLLQVAWCCKLTKCGLIAGGVFCVVAGITSISTGILLNIAQSNCYNASTYGYYDDLYYYDSSVYCDSSAGLAVLAYIGGVVMLAAGVLTFVFACGSRYVRFHDDDDDDDNHEGGKYAASSSPTVIATEVEQAAKPIPTQAFSNPPPVPGTSTTTIFQMPDGSRKIVVETSNPDGSITVQETIETKDIMPQHIPDFQRGGMDYHPQEFERINDNV